MQPTYYENTDNPIDKSLIDSHALAIIQRLKDAGFSAYLVGGGVRDLLLGKTPKDYDISTSAKPEEIKRLFGRRCILIGRRFRLAHIRLGHKVYEVATFRAGDTSDDFITHDNIWGEEQEDVLRRDFTINGLFYDPDAHTIIDYVGGMQDLKMHLLQTIGEPEVRFKQDPVRMLRLLKFQARFGFKPSQEALQALGKCLPEISKSSPARILEEIFRMLESCASALFFHLLFEMGMLQILFPKLSEVFVKSHEPILKFLKAADQINKQSSKYPIERPVLNAALLFPLLDEQIQQMKSKPPHLGDIFQLASQLIHTYFLSAFSHFPRKISSTVIYVLTTQYRLTPLTNKRHHPIQMFKVREFPLALRLLKIRASIYVELQPLYIQWREHYRHWLREGGGHSVSAIHKKRVHHGAV